MFRRATEIVRSCLRLFATKKVFVPLLVVCAALLIAFLLRPGEDLQKRFQQGVAALEADDPEGVVRALEHLEKNKAFENHTRYLQAGCLYKMKKYDAALQLLEPTKSDLALQQPVLLLVGKCFFGKGAYAAAEGIFRKLAQDRPDDPEPHRWLVPVYREMGAMNWALAELQQVARIQPNDWEAYRLMGVIYKFDRMENLQAVGCYRRALKLNPPSTDRQAICRELGETLVFQRDYSGALETLTEVEDSSSVWGFRADCYWNLGEHSKAREAVERSLRLGDDRTSLLLKARIHLEENDPLQAMKSLERALELDKHDWESRYQLAIALKKLGRTSEAETQLKQMTESRQLRDQLNELYREARGKPTDVEVRQRIVEACRRLDRNELAAFWERATNLSREIVSSSAH